MNSRYHSDIGHPYITVGLLLLALVAASCSCSRRGEDMGPPRDAGADMDTGTNSDAGTDTRRFTFQDHGFVNPFTGGVAWETSQNADVLAMEWAFVGLSDVYPTCSAAPDWTVVDTFLANVAGRGHQAILRPVVFGPGYGAGSFAPSDLATSSFSYEGDTYDNPRWDLASVQACILQFIDAFAARYKDDQRLAYIQMGLVGLWGEHHLDGRPYTASSFPSNAFQKTMISHYLDGFGDTSADLLCSLSLDAAQSHGFFGSADASLDAERVGFFDDTLLEANHNSPSGWRQEAAPARQLSLHRRHGWGGEAFWSGCNSNGSWALPPHDCGNGESLGTQAARLGLNYMLGSNAYDGRVARAALLTASQLMGYKFTVTTVTRLGTGDLAVTIENTGVAFCPYAVEVCTQQGCAGDLSTLAPGTSTVVTLPASSSSTQVLSLASPRLLPTSAQKLRFSNAEADAGAATLTITFGGA
ncbi:MAG: hypothetical protein H6725_18005 [Sandaracinaceae bacterium]|nr:hypothetical protein [Sandaracinaceae bacterium]